MAVRKNIINYIINWIAFILGTTTLVTGIIRFSNIMAFIVMNIGPVNVHLINFIHRWSGVFTGIIVFIHIILHWQWIIKTTKNLLGLKRK